ARRLAALVRARAIGGQGGQRRRGSPGAGARTRAEPARPVPGAAAVTGRSEAPISTPTGRAWIPPLGGPGRERFTLPFAALLAAALAVVGLAAAVSWLDWRWVLLSLCAI